MAINDLLIHSSIDFVNWMKNSALPLWSDKGIDKKTGASYERFLYSGEIDKKVDVRVRVQARQIFTFSKAYSLGWKKDAKPYVDGLTDFANCYGKHESGRGYIHLLSPDYSVKDKKRDLYDHAFWLLANGARYHAFGDPEALMEANAIINYLDSSLGYANGGWFEGDYMSAIRRQNPHMHMFEAFLTLFEATEDEKWLARAGEMFTVFESFFFDPQHFVLREFFGEHWQPIADSLWDAIEPGHMMEWVWLLRWYERLSGHKVGTYANAMYEKGLAIGLAPSGLVYDEVSPTGEIRRGTKRCWPVIELIKASIAQARSGHPTAEALAGKSTRLLVDKYLSTPVPGLYIDQLNEDDTTLLDVAPASTLYHLIVAAAEVDFYCQESGAYMQTETAKAS